MNGESASCQSSRGDYLNLGVLDCTAQVCGCSVQLKVHGGSPEGALAWCGVCCAPAVPALHVVFQSWSAALSRPFVAGQFVWAGWNYGGESGYVTESPCAVRRRCPTLACACVISRWPGVYSYYGVNDVCGFGKPVLE